jgi:hypothetical protein
MSYDDYAPVAAGAQGPDTNNPYTNSAKRARTDGPLDPNRARKLDVGFQGAPATLDGLGIGDVALEKGGVLPRVTTSATSIQYGDPLFMLAGDKSAKPLVRKTFNQLEAAAARAWPGDAVMQALATKAVIQPLGLAAEAVKATQDNLTPSITVKYAGLHNANVLSARNGARLLYDLRPFTANLDMNTAVSRDNVAGVAMAEYQNAYGLVLVAYDERTVGNNFNKHASELVNNSLTWERAMAGYYGKSRPWLAAVMADFRHCLSAGILLVDRLLKAGVLQVVGQGVVSNVVNGRGLNVPRVPIELASTTGVALPSYEVAGRIANYMHLTAPTNPATDFLTPDASAFWETATRTYADSLYYTANAITGGSQDGTVNVAVEFGAEYDVGAQQPTFAGRFPDMKLKEDRIGAVVKFQANHCSQAVAAFAQAVEETYKWTAGTAVSGAPGGIAIMMMHK